VWEVVLGCQISKLCIFIFVPGPQNSYQKLHHICSTLKFVEQNFLFPILSRNLYGTKFQNYEYAIMFKYKIVEQKCNQICSTVKFIEQK
jgi:hypothetical protein